MGKDIKEKYERVCAIKDKAISLVETQLNGDLSHVDAQELGYVSDIAKDMAELMKLCSEAEYYCKVTEAMDEGSKEENSYYLNKYIPEYEGKFYTPMPMARQRDSRGRYMYTEPKMYDEKADEYMDRMYYSSMNGNRNSNSGRSSMSRDYREGRSPMVRRTYMELKENGEGKEKTSKELESYLADLWEDIAEMIEKMEPSEKVILKQKMNQFISKIQ